MNNPNNRNGRKIRESALNYRRGGRMPIPIPSGQKGPVIKKWQDLRPEETDIDELFSEQDNIGILLGEPSGDLIDVDLDSKEALLAADGLLPHTDAIFGRFSKPASHFLYISSPAPATAQFRDLNGEMIAELRSTGCQTVFPPSSHSGEQVNWFSVGEPAKVGGDYLLSRLAMLAAACSLARHWPATGSRQEAALALAGALLRDGYDAVQVRNFIRAVARATGDEETEKRANTAEYTQRKLASGQKTTGWPRLEVLLGAGPVRHTRKLLSTNKRGSQAKPSSGNPKSSAKQSEEKSEHPTTAQILLALAGEAELFHAPDGTSYAIFPVDEHQETWRVGSSALRHWLVRGYYERFHKLPAGEALKDVMEELEHRALYDSPEYPVFLRTASFADSMYLDLCTPDWQVVEITKSSWNVVRNPPVRFRRTNGMRSLPTPVRGGKIEELRSLINASDDKTWTLIMGWLVAAFRPTGPFLILALQGEAGTAKSTTARLLRALIDPSTAPLRSMPSNEDDLMIAAKNSLVLSFDNLSSVSHWQSDALCRLATGGGLSKRRLFTDEDEVILQATRPIILTGIEDLASREDLAERCINIVLAPIAAENRRNERRLEPEFQALQPRILGALIDGICSALRHIDEVDLKNPPRMADAVEWVTAAEGAFGWDSGSFLRAFKENQRDAVAVSIETDSVASAIILLLEDHSAWEGTSATLLAVLNARVNQEVQKSKAWPTSPRALAGRVRRLSPVLRQAGIDVQYSREPGSRRRLITIRLAGLRTGPTGPTGPINGDGSANRDDWDGRDASQAPGDPVSPSGPEGGSQ
jgi:hypothetical protein